MKLTVLADREAETTLCTYCPKLCRPACPVSTVEGRETVTPWGKMRAMGEILRSVVPADHEHAAPAYACTGCMHCFELCDLDNPASETLRDARTDAMRLGIAPQAAVKLVEGFARREANLARIASTELPRTDGRTAYLPGCTAVVFERAGIAAASAAVAKLDGRASCAVVGEKCCGLPLLEAGDREGFVARARAMAARLGSHERVVVGDAGCAHALRKIYPRFGIATPSVVHIAEAAAASLDRLKTLDDAPAAAAYHDSCRLGRGLGVYAEPRAVLARVLGYAPRELPAHHERAPCSGAGAILPVTRPETATAIARELGALAAEVRAETVVTACAASRRQLARAGTATADLAALIARATVS